MTRKLLFDFTHPAEMAGWENVDDVVMGGLSQSTLQWLENGCLSFTGKVSLKNSGGFASIRSPTRDFQLAGTGGIGLRVMGDGKHYKLTIRTDVGYDGIAYQVPLPTVAGAWQEHLFSYDQFIPTYHGQDLTGAPDLDPMRIKRFGFIISGKQEGDFQLQVAAIWAGA